MKKKTRSILEELELMHHARDSRYVIETRAENIIASAINLIDLMENTYTEAEVEDLTRKLLNSIRQKDSLKFKRSLGRVNSGNE